MFPASRQGPENCRVRLRSPDSWWKGRRDGHRPREPLHVSIQLLLRPSSDLLHVSKPAVRSILSSPHAVKCLKRFYGQGWNMILCHWSSGINQWRDQLKPSQILENLARLKGLSKPRTEDNGTSLTFNGKDYTLAQFGKRLKRCKNGLLVSTKLYEILFCLKESNMEIHQHLGPPLERLCLHVLRTQGLVPEHVETRTLYSSFQPNLSQVRHQLPRSPIMHGF